MSNYSANNSMCPRCGGLVAEPNVAYGYAGKWCHCAYRSSMNEPGRQADIDDLRRRLERLEDAQRRDQEQAWRLHQAERNEWIRINDAFASLPGTASPKADAE